MKIPGSCVANREFSRSEEVNTALKFEDLFFLKIDDKTTGYLEIWNKSEQSQMSRQHLLESSNFLLKIVLRTCMVRFTISM